MSVQLPWHNHPFVEDPRYKHCKICGFERDATHHTKKAKRSLASVLKRKKWKIYG